MTSLKSDSFTSSIALRSLLALTALILLVLSNGYLSRIFRPDTSGAAASNERAMADVSEPGTLPASIELDGPMAHMNGNIDALITDMASLQSDIHVKSSTTRAQSGILVELIKQATELKSNAERTGTFQSYASAEQEVIRLHAAATRLASVQL